MSDQEYYMPWGKYKGESIDDVPRSYLNWLMEQEWIEEIKNAKLYNMVIMLSGARYHKLF